MTAVSVANSNTKRYAEHGSEAFNLRMDEVLHRLGARVQGELGSNLIALVLGGGYGRGEGGVNIQDGVEQPYNDLDLFLVVRHKNDAALKTLPAVAHQFEQEIHIAVDFSRPLNAHDLRCLPNSLMYYDLAMGHVVLAGRADALQAVRQRLQSQTLAPVEATRLLLNRGAGLLWAMRVHAGLETAPDPDFIRRNYYKNYQALGDGLLILHGRFQTRSSGRAECLARLENERPAVRALNVLDGYQQGLRFKLSPHAAAPVPGTRLKAAAERWIDVFLHVERLRTQRDWPDPKTYADWDGLREVDKNGPSRWLFNLRANLRHGHWSCRYPREALLRHLPLLLGSDPTSPAWAAESQEFLTIWRGI